MWLDLTFDYRADQTQSQEENHYAAWPRPKHFQITTEAETAR